MLVVTPNRVTVLPGFTESEGKLLLAQWLGKEPRDLSPYAEQILKYCRYASIHNCTRVTTGSNLDNYFAEWPIASY